MSQNVQQVLEYLQQTQSTNKETRELAEKQISIFGNSPGFGHCLVDLLLNSQIPSHLRQLSGIVLKKYVKEHWVPKVSSQEIVPVSQEEKDSLKQKLPSGLCLPDKVVRNATSMIIAAIASLEWPDKWPTIINNLIECLGSQDPNLVDGAITCLDFFSTSYKEHNPTLTNLIFPPLLQIVDSEPARFSERVKMKAVEIFCYYLDELSVSGEVDHSIDTLKAQLPNWIVVFRKQLEMPVQTHQYYGLKVAITETIPLIIHHYTNFISKQISTFLDSLWKALTNIYPVYEEMAVRHNKLVEVELDDSESHSTKGLEPYVSNIIESFLALVSKKKLRAKLKPQLEQLFYVTIHFMQMTEEQVEQYHNDPNEWLADEDDDTLEYSVRIALTKLLQAIFEYYKEEAINPFYAAVGRTLKESEEAFARNDNIWWKQKEASVYAIGIVGEDLNADIKPVMVSILSHDLQNEKYSFVRGRALWTASMLSHIFTHEEILSFLKIASHYLNGNDTLPVQMFACRAVGRLAPHIDRQLMAPFLKEVLIGVVNLVKKDLQKESLYLPLETLHVLLPLSEEVTAQSLDLVAPRILELWAYNYNDPMLVNLIIDIVTDISMFPTCNRILQEKSAESLSNMLVAVTDKILVTVTTLDLAAGILSQACWPIHPLFMNQFFPALCNLMFLSTEDDVLASGSNVLRAIVRVAGPMLLEWKNPSGENGLQIVVKIIAKLLSPEASDPAAINVGPLIDKVISIHREHINSILDSMLTQVLVKLHQLSAGSVHQGLLMIFVKLMVTNTEQTIEYLASKSIEQGVSELVYFLRDWTDQHPIFRGGFKTKLSVVGLCNVFKSNNPHLNNIMVLGDDEITQGGYLLRKKKNKIVRQDDPLKLKILKLLIREHQIILEDERPEDLSDDDIDYYSSGEENEEGPLDPEKQVFAILGEDISEKSLAYLDKMLDARDDDFVQEETKEDPDIKNDPLFNIPLKQLIEDFIKSFAVAHPDVCQMFINHLPDGDKIQLQKHILI